MKILVTGAAGFIGFHTIKKLLAHNHTVVGIDNINDYYDVNLKFARLAQLGIDKEAAENYNLSVQSNSFNENFKFLRLDLQDVGHLNQLFKNEKFEVVCNLAAQAGVRYSIENPKLYVESNINGFFNILECCRNFKINHLVYASSSSVYGLMREVPFETIQNVDKPISLYAATKKSNELMAYTYSHLYGFLTTGLRLFTVYGPWGRPDMAMFLFTDAIANEKPIKIFNHGHLERDFTYIDDITEGIVKIVERKPEERLRNSENYKIYNIGNNKAIKLMDFIEAIEINLEKKAIKEYLPMQPGDVSKTWADITDLIKDYDYRPTTSVKEGVTQFVKWYKSYYNN